MKRLSTTSITIAVMCLALTMLSLGSVSAQDADPLLSLLEKSGLKFDNLEKDSWTVPFAAKDNKTLKVFVTHSNEDKLFVLMFTTVVDREPDFVFNRDVLRECMKLNNDYPAIKFVLDEKEGDLDCQAEAYMSILTPEALALYINSVASLADENAAKLNQLAGGTAPE